MCATSSRSNSKTINIFNLSENADYIGTLFFVCCFSTCPCKYTLFLLVLFFLNWFGLSVASDKGGSEKGNIFQKICAKFGGGRGAFRNMRPLIPPFLPGSPELKGRVIGDLDGLIRSSGIMNIYITVFIAFFRRTEILLD